MPGRAGALASVDKSDLLVRIDGESLPSGCVVRRLRGSEAISRLFDFQVDVVVQGGDEHYEAQGLVNERVSIVFEQDGLDVRTLHGLVAEVRQGREHLQDAVAFSLRVVPTAYLTTLFETQEIFLDLSLPEIIGRKFEQLDLGEQLDLRLRGKYAAREFVVQYRESDHAFLSRLCEHVGVSYFFEHDGPRDRVVFSDTAGFPKLERDVELLPRGDQKGGCWALETRTRMIPAAFVMQEWNYRAPAVELTSSHEAPGGLVGGVIEFGAHYKSPEEGAALARIRAEEAECTRQVFEGTSDVFELEAGRLVELDGKTVLVVEVEHDVTQQVGLHGGGAKRYENRFKAIPGELRYRPPRVTPRPRLHGVMSAIVMDEQGNETGNYPMIDEHGRYLCRLLFDTAGSGETRASRFIRMAQPLSGPGYGTHFPLRPGTEVLLAFTDGDPDRPVIVGSVPNPITPSPVTRANSLNSQIKTATGILIQLKDR